MPDGEEQVRVMDMDLVTCDYRDCPDIGKYTKCYLGLEKLCGKYTEYKSKNKDLKGKE